MTTTSAPAPVVHHHGDGSSAYPLGNDATERERLHVQHKATLALMHNNPIHAPIAGRSIKKIIDIGCGVNADMTKILAAKYPEAKVYGVDLSAVEGDEVPSNVEFIRGNVNNLIGVDERLAPGSADYVYSRFLVAGIEDWESHIKSVARLLAPGGYLEMHDGKAMHWYDLETGEALSKDWEWLKPFEKRAPSDKSDVYGIKDWTGWFQNSGLEDVEAKPYRVRFEPTPFPEEPAAEPYAEYGTTLLWTAMVPPIERWFAGPENAEKRQALIEACKEDLKAEKGKFVPLTVVWGKKPEI